MLTAASSWHGYRRLHRCNVNAHQWRAGYAGPAGLELVGTAGVRAMPAARAACSLEEAITSPGSSCGPPSDADGDMHCLWLYDTLPLRPRQDLRSYATFAGCSCINQCCWLQHSMQNLPLMHQPGTALAIVAPSAQR